MKINSFTILFTYVLFIIIMFDQSSLMDTQRVSYYHFV